MFYGIRYHIYFTFNALFPFCCFPRIPRSTRIAGCGTTWKVAIRVCSSRMRGKAWRRWWRATTLTWWSPRPSSTRSSRTVTSCRSGGCWTPRASAWPRPWVRKSSRVFSCHVEWSVLSNQYKSFLRLTKTIHECTNALQSALRDSCLSTY